MTEFRERVERIVSEITYKAGFTLYVGQDDSRLYFQVINGDAWRGRKWLLSPYMVTSEIVSTAFLAFLTFEEHECREQFTYKGVTVYGPHWNVEDIVEAHNNGDLDEDLRLKTQSR